MPQLITPSIGRIILFIADHEMGLPQDTVPFPAIICKVNDDDTINLSAFDHNGNQFGAQNVPIIEMVEGKEVPAHGHFAYWMPYQLQAATSATAATTAKEPAK